MTSKIYSGYFKICTIGLIAGMDCDKMNCCNDRDECDPGVFEIHTLLTI